MSMISLQGVTKTYAGARATAALRDVRLDIRRGEIFGIIGPSGAGKSTLVRLVNLLERPDSGTVSVNGRSTEGARGRELLTLRRQIGMVFQHFNLLSAKTVAENVAFPLKLAGVRDRATIRARVAELLDRVGLTDHASKYPRQLSGGQKQRVGIARALACAPAILLCDEATSALDPETTRSVLRLLSEINRELGLTIVLITHEMDVVRQICHRVAVLEVGRIVETGSVEEVFLHPRHPATVALVREAVGEDAVAAGQSGVPPAAGSVYRLTFLGQGARSPILGEIARTQGVDFSILGGQIGRIRDKPYAQLAVSLTGGDISRALTLLGAEGVLVEPLSPIAEGASAVSSHIALREPAHVV